MPTELLLEREWGIANGLQNAVVSIWLYEQLAIRIEGKIRVRPPHACLDTNVLTEAIVGVRRIHESRSRRCCGGQAGYQDEPRRV